MGDNMRFHNSRHIFVLLALLVSFGCGQKRTPLVDDISEPIEPNTVPRGLAATFAVEKNSSLTQQLAGADADGDPLTFLLSAPAQHGSVSVTSAGSFTYTPQSGYLGADSFAFKVSDGIDESIATLVNLNVLATQVNPAPSGTFTAVPETGAVFVSGGKARLTWDIVNATACKLNTLDVAVSGTTLTAELTAQTAFTLVCTGSGGSYTFVQTVTPGTSPVTLAVPGSFSALAIAGNKVTLTWEYDASSATFFSFVRKNPSGPDTIWTVPATDRSFTDQDLAANSAHIYKMRAGSPTAESAFTDSITVTTIPANPTLPPNVAAVDLARTSSSVLTASWPAASGATSYRVSHALASTGVSNCNTATAVSGLSHPISGLNPYMDYQVRVCAANSVGSAAGVVANAKTKDRDPVNVTNFVQVTPSTNELTFNWTFSGVNLNVAGEFLLKMSESTTGAATAPADCSSGVSVPLAARSYQFANLVSNKSYGVRICTKNGDGMISGGVALNGLYTIPPAPPNPTWGTTVRNPTSLEIHWVSGGGSTASYLFKYQPGNIAPANCDAGTPVNGTSILLAGLNQNASYSGRVCAVNANNVRSSGITGTYTTTMTPPPNPTGWTVSARTASSVTIAWTSGGGTTAQYLFKSVAGATPPADCVGGVVVTGTSYLAQNLSPDSVYSGRVCAQNAAGDLSSGLVGQASTYPALPPNPTSWATTARTVNSLSVSWVSGGGSTVGYRFKYTQGSTPPANCDGGVEITQPNYVMSNLLANTQYAARVCALNSAAQASSGLAGSDTTLSSIPPNPSWGTTVRSYRSLELNWTSGGGTTASYLVRWAQGSTAPLTCNGGTVVTGTNYLISNLSPDTSYSARICAQNVGGERSSGITGTDRTLVAMPPNPVWGVTDRALTTLRVRWSSGGGSTASYIFRYVEGSNPPNNCTSGMAVQGTEVFLQGLKANTNYSARLCAVGETGEISSGIVSTNRTLSSIPPNSAGFNPTVRTSTTFRVSWLPAGGTTVGYHIKLSEGNNYPNNCNDPTYVVTEPTVLMTGLKPGQRYAARVCSVNAGGELSSGLTGREETMEPPPEPSFTTNVKTSNSIQWNFTSGGGTTVAIMIKVVQGANNPNNCSGGVRVNLTGNAGSFASTGLANNNRYSARICAVDADGVQSNGRAKTERTN